MVQLSVRDVHNVHDSGTLPVYRGCKRYVSRRNLRVGTSDIMNPTSYIPILEPLAGRRRLLQLLVTHLKRM
jgi:hypothetical protein